MGVADGEVAGVGGLLACVADAGPVGMDAGRLVADGAAVGEAVGLGTVVGAGVEGTVANSTGNVGTEASSCLELGGGPPFPELAPPPPVPPLEPLPLDPLPLEPPELEPPEPEFVDPLFEAAAGSVVVVPKKRITSMSAAKAPAHPLRSRCSLAWVKRRRRCCIMAHRVVIARTSVRLACDSLHRCDEK
jgi:hypothetical protein